MRRRNAGKKKGPGIPDGTGPYGDTNLCPLNKKNEIINEILNEEIGRGFGLGRGFGRGFGLGLRRRKLDGTGPLGDTNLCPVNNNKK